MISLTSPYKTRAHDWPAGAKLAGLCLATMFLFAFDSVVFHICALCAVLLLYRLPGLEFFRAGLSYLRFLWPFVGLVLIWHVLAGDLESGVQIVLRMLTAVALANLVTMTTKLSDLMEVVRFLLAPLRRLGLRLGALETALPLLIRFVPVLIARVGQLLMSWRARSVRRPTWQIVLPMMLIALDDAEHVAEALRARGGALSSE